MTLPTNKAVFVKKGSFPLWILPCKDALVSCVITLFLQTNKNITDSELCYAKNITDPCDGIDCGKNARCVVDPETIVQKCVCNEGFLPNNTAEDGCFCM